MKFRKNELPELKRICDIQQKISLWIECVGFLLPCVSTPLRTVPRLQSEPNPSVPGPVWVSCLGKGGDSVPLVLGSRQDRHWSLAPVWGTVCDRATFGNGLETVGSVLPGPPPLSLGWPLVPSPSRSGTPFALPARPRWRGEPEGSLHRRSPGLGVAFERRRWGGPGRSNLPASRVGVG